MKPIIHTLKQTWFRFFIILFLLLLVVTRFVNLEWGLPYPMHPDERNMAVAIMQFTCETTPLQTCLNPNFFAYGQFPLYLAYGMAKVYQLSQNAFYTPVTFEQATIALRIIAAVSSVATAYLIYASFYLIISRHFFKPPKKTSKKPPTILVNKKVFALISLVIVFVPGFIQFSRYGTTESLLMMAYAAVIYLALRALYRQINVLPYIFFNGVICGLALATKVSALPYLVIPWAVTLSFYFSRMPADLASGMLHTEELKTIPLKIIKVIGAWSMLGVVTLFCLIVGSPYNMISFEQFISSMQYESAVGFGEMLVFYTRQFFDTPPVVFQLNHILPFVLGMPLFNACIAGFILLPWKSKDINLLRFSFLLYFLPQAFVFAKWTRFIAPVFPILVLIGLLALYFLYEYLIKHFSTGIHRRLSQAGIGLLVFITLLPGIAFTSIYLHEDIRYTASRYIYDTVFDGAYILSETANVIDMPILPADAEPRFKNFTYISFDFYHLHENPLLRDELRSHLNRADYIFVPTRRVFGNHTCLKPEPLESNPQNQALLSIPQELAIPPVNTNQERCRKLNEMYPQLNQYYSDLFSGTLGFTQVAEFSMYPNITLFGIPLLVFPDEYAEETWTVFDHPVVRIYKRTNSSY